MRHEIILPKLVELIRDNPKPEGQSDRERALDVLTRLIASLDETHAREVQASQARAAMYYYAFHEKSTNTNHTVPINDLPAFCEMYRLDVDQMREVGMGQVLEHLGFRRANLPHNAYLLGAPYKPIKPRTEPDAYQKKLLKEAEADRKRTEGMNQDKYVMPEPPKLSPFTPKQKEVR